MTESKPLNWSPTANVGYSVIRRGDGGMTLTFTDLSDATLAHWHEFALAHLLEADRRTRNLYDLRRSLKKPSAWLWMQTATHLRGISVLRLWWQINLWPMRFAMWQRALCQRQLLP
jgi:hypothetical protein